jgi:hypothetical protein
MHGMLFCYYFCLDVSAAAVECCETESETSGRRVGVKGPEGERHTTELPLWG